MIKIPKGQKLWCTYRDENGRVIWAITSDPARTIYTLHKVYGEELKKTKTASSPAKFEETIGRRI